jgi:hypothetical protein
MKDHQIIEMPRQSRKKKRLAMGSGEEPSRQIEVNTHNNDNGFHEQQQQQQQKKDQLLPEHI